MDQKVKSELRCWFIERLKDLIEQYSDDLKLLLQCAKIMYLLGFCEEAFSHYQNAHYLFVSHHGRNHLDVASCVLGLENVHEEALKHYECALGIRLQKLGECHPDVANTDNNMAIVYDKQNHPNKALEYDDKALKIRLSTLGENHLNKL